MNLRERIWLIPDGIPFATEKMTVKIHSDKLLVTHHIENLRNEFLTKDNSIIILENLKNQFSLLMLQYDELQSIIELNNLKIEYNLTFSDGINQTAICSEIEGKINWYL